MVKLRWLETACTLALLAATPALAQRPEAGMTNANGKPNPEATQPNQSTTGMAPANNGANSTSMVNPGSGTDTATEDHPTHHHSMAHSAKMMHSRNSESQDAAVDQLNDQSYQAAQKGQTFSLNGNNTSPSATTMPSAPGSAKP